jgi:hypothetical protein
MDRNGNGVVEPGELDDRARGFVERMARDAGLDPNRPMPISRLAGGGSSRGGDRGRDRGGDRGRGDDRRGSSSSSEQLYPLIRGFGEESALGFGINPLTLDGKVVNLEKRYDRRVLESVDRTMERYDKNGNGVLEYTEWRDVSWRGDPRESDLDGDGRLTKAEMAERTAKREEEEQQRRSERDRGRGGGPGFMMMGRGGPGFMGRGGPGFMGPGGPGGGFMGRGQGEGDEGGRGGRGDRGRDGGGRGGRGGGRGGFDPSAMLSRFDPEGTGVIKLDQLDERQRQIAGFVLRRFGMDPDQNEVRVDEIRQRMEQANRERSGDSRRSGNRGQEAEKKSADAYRVAGADRFKGRRSYAAAKPDLPETLPGWWDRKDGNEDGQVSMAEFMAGSSARDIDDFLDHDLNEDGVITAHEAEIVASEN